MSVLETLLWFGVPVVGICLLVLLAVVGPKQARRPRHRVGQSWDYDPLWWTADPDAAELPAPSNRAIGAGAGERGGARGSW